jgi:hypothetical protein
MVIDGGTFDQLKAPLVLYNTIPQFPVSSPDHIYKYSMYENVGVGTYTARYADDIPIVNRVGKQFFQALIEVKHAIEYSEYQIQRKLLHNDRTIDDLLKHCYRGILETMETTLIRGYKPQGLKGLFDYDAGATAVATNWYAPETTSTNIFDDIKAAYMSVTNATASLIKPNLMLCSPGLELLLKTKPMSIGTSYTGTTVAQFVESALNIQILAIPMLTLAFGNNDRDGFFLIANNSQYIEHPIESSFLTMPPQIKAFTYTTYIKIAHGGIVSKHPKSIIARKMAAPPA